MRARAGKTAMAATRSRTVQRVRAAGFTYSGSALAGLPARGVAPAVPAVRLWTVVLVLVLGCSSTGWAQESPATLPPSALEVPAVAPAQPEVTGHTGFRSLFKDLIG